MRFGAVRNNEDAKMSPGSVPVARASSAREENRRYRRARLGHSTVGPSTSSPFQIVQNRYYGADDVSCPRAATASGLAPKLPEYRLR